jgi:hypothetical protein
MFQKGKLYRYNYRHIDSLFKYGEFVMCISNKIFVRYGPYGDVNKFITKNGLIEFCELSWQEWFDEVVL